MSFGIARPNVLNMRVNELQEQPNAGGLLAEGLGKGLGDVLQDKLKQDILQRALGKISPNSSPLDKYLALSQVDRELAKGYAPILKEEMKQQRSLADQQALGSFYNSQMGTGKSIQSSPSGTQAIQPNQQPVQQEQQGQTVSNTPSIPGVDFTQLSPSMQKLVGDQMMKKEALNSKEKIAARKESQDYRNQVMNNYKKSIYTQSRLNRIQQLGKSKNLPTPMQYKLITALGLPEGVMSGEAQELQKLSTELTSGVTDAYRGRILDFEVRNFAHTLPNLMQSKEGRERVIRNTMLLKDPVALEYKTMKEIIKENGGEVPFGLPEKVTERMEGYLEKFKDDFGRQGDKSVNIPQGFVKIVNPQTKESFWVSPEGAKQAQSEGFVVQ